MKIDSREKVQTHCLYMVTLLIPCLFLLLWYIMQGHGFLAAKPYYSDELGYWRVMYSFSRCGFDFGSGGGFAGSEAPVGPLGSHGLSPIFAWGWYALLFPWTGSAIFIADFIMLTVSIGAFLLLVKPGKREMLLIFPALALYAPIALYINTCMMEISCVAAVILYTGLYLRWREKKEKAVFILAIILGIYLAELRIIYVILLFPLLWERVGFRIKGKALPVFLCFAAGSIGLYVVSSFFVTPYPLDPIAKVLSLPLRDMIPVLFSRFLRNGRIYLRLCLQCDTEAAFRWLYLAVMLFFGIDSMADRERRWRSFSFFLIYGAILFVNLLLYDVGGWLDFRMMSPALVFALLCVMTERKSIKGAKTVILVLTAVLFFTAFHSVAADRAFIHEGRFGKSIDNREAFSEIFGEEKASVSTMCEDGVFERLKDIPAQIGVKWMFDEGGTIRSDTEFIMIGSDEREVSSDYVFVGRPAEKCYVYKRVN